MMKDVTYHCRNCNLYPEFNTPILKSPNIFNTTMVHHFPSLVVGGKVVGVGLNWESFVAGPSAGLPGFGT